MSHKNLNSVRPLMCSYIQENKNKKIKSSREVVVAVSPITFSKWWNNIFSLFFLLICSWVCKFIQFQLIDYLFLISLWILIFSFRSNIEICVRNVNVCFNVCLISIFLEIISVFRWPILTWDEINRLFIVNCVKFIWSHNECSLLVLVDFLLTYWCEVMNE